MWGDRFSNGETTLMAEPVFAMSRGASVKGVESRLAQLL
jgi:hypothetical protein